ncbi:MAG TPA: biotin/lipoyl-containing protein [Rhodocyclaceae bacterium]
MRNFRITVDGTAYEVCVEELESGDKPTPAPRAAVAPPRSAPPAAAPPPPVAPRPAAGSPGDILSPLAGTVVKVETSVGQQISQGQNLIMLEAMKMNTYVTATRAGTVRAIHVAAGASVAEGQPLLSVE